MNVELDARSALPGLRFPLKPRLDPETAPGAAFLSIDHRRAALRERTALAERGSAPDYFLRETMQWAKDAPEDPRVPEALHYALRSQRYGCATKQTAQAAERAWRYLWMRYPKNPWTPKSNYPFEDEHLPYVREF
ncbi:MAG: hypothetical protein ABI693_34670 [Bryobacteraceae bacterium]